MIDQLLLVLKRKLNDISASGMMDAETQRNAIKEELHFYLLNFVYHHPEYGKWTMYGGSALRICHGLDRMSVDLDFEVSHPITDRFLDTLRVDVASHFEDTYGSGPDVLTIKPMTGRGLLLRFHLGDALGIEHPSKQIHVKVDLNHFVAPGTVVERRPINRDQLSFVIRTYNMAALMASKIAAIFLRGQRGVGTTIYEEKGRDIYDLLWYMTKKVVPDLQYLKAKGIDANDPRQLFDKLTVQMNRWSDVNLKQDLTPLFLNQAYIAHWLQHWRESYIQLREDYGIRTVAALTSVTVQQEFYTDVYYFGYEYRTEDGGVVRFIYALSDYWITFGPGDLRIEPDQTISDLITFSRHFASSGRIPEAVLKQYAALFHRKTESYLNKTHHVVLGDVVRTKVIRMTADNLDQKEQILLDPSALLACELEDLLR